MIDNKINLKNNMYRITVIFIKYKCILLSIVYSPLKLKEIFMKKFVHGSVCLVFVKGESVLIFNSSILMTFIKQIKESVK